MIEWTVGLYDFEANADPNSIVENQALLSAEAWDYIQFMVPGGYDGAAYCPPYVEMMQVHISIMEVILSIATLRKSDVRRSCT